VSYCSNCGFPLPNGAEYCPNCGVPVRRKPAFQQFPSVSIGKVMQAGMLGAFLSVMISSLSMSEIQLYFIPSFVSSVIVIFLFKARKLEEAVIISLSAYLFADAILGGIMLGSLYVQNIPLSEIYSGYMLTFLDVVMYVFNPISALIAAYAGNRLILSMGGKTETQRRVDYRIKEKEEPGGIIYSTQLKPHSHKV